MKPVPKVSDIKLPKDYTINGTGITQSLLANFMTCRQKFLFAVNRWAPKQGNKNVDFGSLFHQLLDNAYHRKKPPEWNRIGKWIDEYFEKNQELMSSSIEEQERMAVVAQVLIVEYCNFYKKDWEDRKFTEIEQVFDVNFNGARLLGKIDGGYDIVKTKVKHWLMEHKTKGRIEEDFLTLMLTFDFQNLFYITAREKGTGKNIYGVLYNVVRNPGIRLNSTESLESYATRLQRAIKKDPKHYFKRYEIPYTESDKELFRKELKIKLDELKLFLRGVLKPYRNQHACTTPYRCQYLDACSSNSLAGYKQNPKLFSELGEAYGRPQRSK
jgi:hypothetical protein